MSLQVCFIVFLVVRKYLPYKRNCVTGLNWTAVGAAHISATLWHEKPASPFCVVSLLLFIALWFGRGTSALRRRRFSQFPVSLSASNTIVTSIDYWTIC